jgi:S-adenosylmethionine-diacylglycerol 3-amino-3-carboxypropyl transferase
MNRLDPKILLDARTLEEQQQIFNEKFAPMFDRKFIRWITDQRSSLFGLGIPPAQYDALAGDRQMADVLRARLEKLSCGFPLNENYFAWQAFGRGYGKGPDVPLPPYLQESNYDAIKARADRVDMRHANMTDMLAMSENSSFDRFILLDAQDWMSDEQLTALWAEITRAARPGARVLFRTVPDGLLARWDYRSADSLDFTARDRSAIYGGVHLYQLKD